MRRCFAALFALALAASGAFAAAGAPAELAVAIRYLQAEGTSHAHIYLYREDGKLLRQLTKDDSGQDFDPIFAPDGQTIVFRREKKSGAIEFWSIDPLGSLEAGALASWLGTSFALAFGAVICAIAGLWTLLVIRRREVALGRA